MELNLGEMPVKPSHSELRRRAFDSFRSTMPPPVASATEKFQSRQWAVLKFINQCASALDLARINPALCFALATHVCFRQQSGTPATDPKISGRRQRDIADWLGFPGTESVARILSKVAAESVSVGLLLSLRCALKDEHIVKVFSHLPKLNAGVTSIVLQRELLDATTPALLTEILECTAEKSRAASAEMLEDTLSMLRLVAPGAGTPKIQSVARLRAMHSEVITKFLITRPYGTGNPRLPHPPLRGTETIVPILTVGDLVQEGRMQKNCVATYAELIRKRSTFIYRVLFPERATLSILRGSDGDWQIGELKGSGNAKVSTSTRTAVESWLDQSAFAVSLRL